VKRFTRVRFELGSVAAYIALLALAGCGGASSAVPGGPNPSPSPSMSPQAVHYVALGDGRAVGTTAAVPCTVPAGSILISPPNCPGGTGYVPKLAALLGPSGTANLIDLGINNSMLGPDLDPITGATLDIVTNELPSVPSNATVVTLFAGINEIDGIAANAGVIAQSGSDPTSYINTQIGKVEADYLNIISQVKAKAPGAKIVAVNLPNRRFSRLQDPPQVQAYEGMISLALDIFIDGLHAPPAVRVADVLCNAQFYSNPGKFMKTDADHTLLANVLAATINTSAPPPPQGLPAPGCIPYSWATPTPMPSGGGRTRSSSRSPASASSNTPPPPTIPSPHTPPVIWRLQCSPSSPPSAWPARRR